MDRKGEVEDVGEEVPGGAGEAKIGRFLAVWSAQGSSGPVPAEVAELRARDGAQFHKQGGRNSQSPAGLGGGSPKRKVASVEVGEQIERKKMRWVDKNEENALMKIIKMGL
ncbi:hypothetical protein RJT34_07169 [Clitoria ternatea]|uniref:Uncharacterized protein n=1 Tax=Clitoria ternatea TaxID=43366 RepID=A0AAN9K319_CLITE